ncbi:MAG: HRDC domain-containing protein [Saprospiraceae bacterium]|nr:HRDC domain-containing protein [Saprospiraceae bacterium]
MDPSERTKIQKEFQDDELQFICATIAFGMGIDKSNIRWIIHFSMPKNLEGYYQEIGRAGRDGTQARALLFYGWNDYTIQKRFIDESEANQTFKTVQYAKLERMWEYANASECRTNLVLNYFGEYRSEGCGHCDNCLAPPKGFNASIIAQKALSAVKRTNEEVSMNILIDILRGSGRAEIRDAGYDRIKTFGAGRDISFIDWKIYITQMVNQGFLKIDYTDGFKLKLTPLSDAVLFENKQVKMVQISFGAEIAPKEKAKPAIQFVEEGLMQELKSWRSVLAKEKAVPAYVIFPDKVFEQIVEKMPLTKGALENVEGIGRVKLEQYGEQLLFIIQKFINTQDHKKNIKGKTYLDTLMLYKLGLSPEEIAGQRGISVVTVFSHFAHLYNQDEEIDLLKYVSITEIQLIEEAWKKGGKAMELAVIAENLKAPLEFHKIRLALAYLLKKEKQGNK